MYRIILPLVLVAACKDYTNIPDSYDLLYEGAFKNEATIKKVLIGLYGTFDQNDAWADSYTAVIDPLMSDENYNAQLSTGWLEANFYQTLSISSADELCPKIYNLWSKYYATIYAANRFLENMPGVTTEVLDTTSNKAYQGAALYFRALSYYLLVRSWGDVPLILSSNVTENSVSQMPRIQSAIIINQIISDLEKAVRYLPSDPSVLPANVLGARNLYHQYITTKFVPEALLVKVYLTSGKYKEAKELASDIIDNGPFGLEPVDNVFYRPSKETIFALANHLNPNNDDQSLEDMAVNFALSYPFPGTGIFDWMTFGVSTELSPTLVHCVDTVNDLRWKNWTTRGKELDGYGNDYQTTVSWRIFQYKYRYTSTNSFYDFSSYETPTPGKEQDFIVHRLGEIYLLRAEAEAKLNDADGALKDINVIRHRAGLNDALATTLPDVLQAVLDESLREMLKAGGWMFYNVSRNKMSFLAQFLIKPVMMQNETASCPYRLKNSKRILILFKIPDINHRNFFI